MNIKNILGIVIGLVVLAGIIFIVAKKPATLPTDSATVNTTSTTGVTDTGGSVTDTTTTVITTTTTSATYTMADVSIHNSKTDCWSAINGSVYNLTPWVGKHPGGQQAIAGICGKDGSAVFNGQHGGQARPTTELVGFKIGTLN